MTFEAPIMWKNAKYLRDPRAATICGLDVLKIGEGHWWWGHAYTGSYRYAQREARHRTRGRSLHSEE